MILGDERALLLLSWEGSRLFFVVVFFKIAVDDIRRRTGFVAIVLRGKLSVLRSGIF